MAERHVVLTWTAEDEHEKGKGVVREFHDEAEAENMAAQCKRDGLRVIVYSEYAQ